jgi:cytochrome c oxidase subunit 3
VTRGLEYGPLLEESLVWGVYFDPRHSKPHRGEIGVEPDEAVERVLVDTPIDYAPVVPGSDLLNPDFPLARQRVDPQIAEAIRTAPSAGRIGGVHRFFALYFLMTGLHAIHVLAGLLLFLWLLRRTFRGDFAHRYHLPLDLGAKFWHLVTVIGIYLFPLLYSI